MQYVTSEICWHDALDQQPEIGGFNRAPQFGRDGTQIHRDASAVQFADRGKDSLMISQQKVFSR
jgi:hypothetical protein